MKKLATISILITLGLLAYTSYLALVVAPTEQTMGDVQRIFYYHVPSGWVGMLCFGVNFLASIWYLWKRTAASDALAAASAEVGVVYCAVLLITGPLWARPVWGIWWTWDARLTSTLVLWLIYVSYLVLRRFAAGGQTQVIAAVFAVFGFADVPHGVFFDSLVSHPASFPGDGRRREFRPGSGDAACLPHQSDGLHRAGNSVCMAALQVGDAGAGAGVGACPSRAERSVAMNPIAFLKTAYIVAWVVYLGYLGRILLRMKKVDDELKEMERGK